MKEQEGALKDEERKSRINLENKDCRQERVVKEGLAKMFKVF